jgi:mannitol/fructose-specific phosphotransferase system IIA component (Ntr-type)
LESKELAEAAGRALASMEAERLKNVVLRSFSYDLAEPSQEISEGVTELLRNPAIQTAELKPRIKTLAEKADQIKRVVARLPQFLREVFPSTEWKSAVGSVSKSTGPYSLSEALKPERILFFPIQTTKEEILKELVGTLGLPDPSGTLRSIEDREEAGGILIRPNVAIPHTTIPGIQGVIAALGIQRSLDPADPSRFWMLFVSGTESIKEHLEFLRNIVLVFNAQVLEELDDVSTSDDVLRILQHAEQPAAQKITS